MSMLFQDKTRPFIEQLVEIARDVLNRERINFAWLCEDYRRGTQLERLDEVTGAKGVKYDELPKLVFPFCDTVLSERGQTYKRTPTRYFDSERPTRKNNGIWKKSPWDEAVAKWHTLAEEDECDYTPTLCELDKGADFHGREIVRVWPAYSPQSRQHRQGRNYPRFDVFHPGQFDVVCEPGYPARPVAVILYLSSAQSGGAEHAQIWTDRGSLEVIGGVAGPLIPHKLGVLPFIGFANYVDPQEYWREGLRLKLVRQNAIFDLGWTHLAGMCIEQAHGQPWVKNAEGKWIKNPKWGWQEVLNLGDEGEFGFANAGADIDGMMSVLEKMLERVFMTCGLATNRFREDSGQESGDAYRLKHASLLSYLEGRSMIMTPREKQLWRMAFLVGGVFGLHNLPGTYGDPKNILIEHAKPEIPVPQREAIEKRDSDLKAGLISMVDEYRKANPDLGSDTEALEELRRNAAINAEFLGIKAQPTLKDLVGQARKTAAGSAQDVGRAVEDEVTA